MYFKFILLLSLYILGCGLRIGDVYKTPPLKKAMGCMNHLGEQLEGYLQQNIPEEEIGTFSRCLQSALIMFKHHVQGGDEEFYTPNELRRFIQKYFLTDHKFSESLMEHLMVLKVNFVGGKQSELTDSEIDQVISLIQRIEVFMNSIYPYNQALFSLKKTNSRKIHQGLVHLRKNLKSLFQDTFKQPYSLDGVDTMSRDLMYLLDVDAKNSTSLQTIKLIKPLVSFIFNQLQKNNIELNEWSDLLDGMMDLYSSFVYYRKASHESLSLHDRVFLYSDALKWLIFFLENRLSSKWYHSSIPGTLIQSLAHDLHQRGIVPIGRESLERLAQVVFGKIITHYPNDDFAFEIKTENLQWLKFERERWISLQQLFTRAFIGATVPTRSLPQIEAFSADVQRDFFSILEFKTLYNETQKEDYSVYLMYDQLMWAKGYKNATLHNTYWSVVRALNRGYAKAFPDQGITMEEMRKFLKDIYGVVSDLGFGHSLGDPASESFGKTEFVSANLITYVTEGFYTDSWVLNEESEEIELMSQKEATEYLSFIQLLIQTLQSLRKNINQLCVDQGVSLSCFYENILIAVKNSMPHMPHLISFIESMNAEEVKFYVDLLYKVAMIGNNQTSSTLEDVHLRNIVLALVYQEGTFTRFDLNADALLDDDEIEEGYTLYNGLIKYVGKDILCRDDGDFIRAILYSYIISERKVPPMQGISSWDENKLFFSALHADWGPWVDLELTRPQLMELTLNLMETLVRKKDDFGQCELVMTE